MDQPLTAARLHLADARRRGQPFVVAWPAALDAALAASGDAELAETFDALTATWPAWWAGYERAPVHLARVTSALID